MRSQQLVSANSHRLDTHPLIARLHSRAESLGQALSRRAHHAGLAVTAADGTQRTIPVGALPLIVSEADIQHRARMAHLLLRATDKAARWRLVNSEREVLTALGPAERRLVGATWDAPSDLAVARVDFLGSPLQALEVNTTIPAMQGYSDIAAEAWLSTFAAHRSDLAELIHANGSNAQALLQSLVEHYRQKRGDELRRIGLLCRRRDAQLTELLFLRDRFVRAGFQASIVHPDELTESNGDLKFNGQALQLLYRHVFVSRFDAHPAPVVEAAMLSRSTRGTVVLNRATPHLEMKSTLAALSSAVDTPLARAMGLAEDEVDAIRELVPWTRPLRGEVLDHVAAEPDAYVIKRSWSYGGNEVFVGRARHTDGFWARVQTTLPGVDCWDRLVSDAALDTRGGGFIVQRAVPRYQNTQLLCTPDGSRWRDVTTDYAAYASLGSSPPWGGVSRAAASDIVNIVGGGAVVPVIRKEIADRLLGG